MSKGFSIYFSKEAAEVYPEMLDQMASLIDGFTKQLDGKRTDEKGISIFVNMLMGKQFLNELAEKMRKKLAKLED